MYDIILCYVTLIILSSLLALYFISYTIITIIITIMCICIYIYIYIHIRILSYTLCYVTFCSVMFCSALLCYVMSCYVILCSVLFCSVLSCCVTPSPPTKSFPTKSPRVELSGRLPMKFYGHENSHPLRIKSLLESNPPRPKLFVGGLGVAIQVAGRLPDGRASAARRLGAHRQEKAYDHSCHTLPFRPILRSRRFPSELVKATQNSPRSISEGGRI